MTARFEPAGPSIRSQRVAVFSIARRPGTARPWLVKWRVDGRDRTRAFRTKGQASAWQARLLMAESRLEVFDPQTGEPTSWQRSPDTALSLADEFVRARWPTLKPQSRDGLVEGVAAACLGLVRADQLRAISTATEDGRVLRRRVWRHLRSSLGSGASPSHADEQAAGWIARASLRVAEIDARAAEQVMAAVSVNLSGHPLADTTYARRRSGANSLLEYAVDRELLERNPLTRTRRSAHRAAPVDPLTVPDVRQARRLIEAITGHGRTGSRYRAYFATLLLAGLRPTEARALRRNQVELPHPGWGTLYLHGGRSLAGARWTDDGSPAADVALKRRASREVRPVPIPPQLVAELAAHIQAYPMGPTERVFSNGAGGEVHPSNLRRLWLKAVEEVFPTGPLRAITPYHLRHANASAMFADGVPVAEIARRLGHTVPVLLQVYANVVAGDVERANELIGARLAAQW